MGLFGIIAACATGMADKAPAKNASVVRVMKDDRGNSCLLLLELCTNGFPHQRCISPEKGGILDNVSIGPGKASFAFECRKALDGQCSKVDWITTDGPERKSLLVGKNERITVGCAAGKPYDVVVERETRLTEPAE